MTCASCEQCTSRACFGLLLLGCMLLCAATTTTVTVGSEIELQQALLDSNVSRITVEQDIVFGRQAWDDFYSTAQPYILARNLTIDAAPLLRKIDFSFIGDGRVQLAPNVTLNFSSIILEHARYGAGMQLDFVASSPGSYLVLWNSVIMRMACVSNKREPDAVAMQPRLAGFPGHQTAIYRDGYCLRQQCHDDVLVYEDFTKITGGSTDDTAAGGYALIMRNTSKVCLKFSEDSCLVPAWSVDNCIRAMLDRLSPVPTPGRLAAAAEAAAQHRTTALAVGLAVGLGAGMALVLAVLLVVLKRRRRQQRQHAQQQLLPEPSAATPGGTADLEAGVSGKDASFVSRHGKGYSGSGTPPGTHDSWELAACKTSDRFRSAQHHSGSADLQQWSMSGGSWYLKGAGFAVNSAAVPAPTAVSLIGGSAGDDNKITLGVLLGAGSFGRVYKGRWRSMDVAVKVLQHSRVAARSVANEVDLMMSFQHPHIVSAYHFVSWKRRRSRAEYKSSATEGEDQHQSADADSWHTGTGSHPAGVCGDPHGELPEDTQTWIVQEFCDAGSLSEYFDKQAEARQDGELPEGHAMIKLLFRLREVSEGMSYLHGRDVVHGDLKSGNVLLSVSSTAPYGRTAKVTDFGLSRALVTGQTHRSTHSLGTVSHMAPELLRFGKMSPAVDVFAFGIMMWELLTGLIAFKGLHYGAIIEHVALMGVRPPIPDGAAEDYVLLMCSCWHPDPQQRPTFEQVIKCIDIMITSRQQELVEAKSGSSFAAAHSSSLDCTTVQHVSQSSGEFDLTITTCSGSRMQSQASLAQPQGQLQRQVSMVSTSSEANRLPGQRRGSLLGPARTSSGVSDAWMAGPHGPQDL